ncbi:hypothetical protein CIL05_17460 [Virgibacillus profundi]|uniref:Preprotein translocase subunit SecA n=1 Tax=Virgibacillus profundi TaxID=2024555 RepID=A0A2A2IAS9_9BACI|nr:hypothetical protein CIL05_17460 [Virgibacillus profundi]PXY52337.1 hypothetical protein CIT14_18310 [Virgibacillus profundi]
MVMIGNKSGPCPNCGSMGHVPDGTYRLVENIIQVLSAPERTIDELKRFADLLEKTRKEEITTAELEKETEKELPGLHPLLDWVIPGNRAEKFSFGMVVLGTALNIFASTLLNNQPTEDIEPEVIINNIYEIQEYNTYENQPIIVEKVGRNAPCPCGSGIKYKKCHGK